MPAHSSKSECLPAHPALIVAMTLVLQLLLMDLPGPFPEMPVYAVAAIVWVCVAGGTFLATRASDQFTVNTLLFVYLPLMTIIIGGLVRSAPTIFLNQAWFW